MLALRLVSTVFTILCLHGSWTIMVDGKSNLENHSAGDRSSSLPWNVLIDNSKGNQSHTNSYNHGQTYYYSPSTYGQSTQSSEPQPSFSYPSSTTSTTTPSPEYSPQVKSPVTYYNFDGSPFNTAASSTVRNKITFPGSAYFKPGTNSNSPNGYSNPPQGYTNSQQSYHNSQPSYSSPNRNSQYYYTHKDRHSQQDDQEDSYEDRYKPSSSSSSSSDDYDEDEEPSFPSRTSSVYHSKRRPGHKTHIHKYQDNDDMEAPDKADFERPEESEKTPTYSDAPWNRYGNKFGPYGPHSYPGGYGFDYDKMAFAGKDPYGTPWAFLLGLLPLGLLMAAMVPNVVSVPLAAAAAAGVTGRRRRDILRPSLQYPVLEAITRFGVANLDDPKCLQRIFCNVTRAGRSDRANIVQKAFYRLITIIDENWVERLGLKQLFRAVRTNQCDAFTCAKGEKPTQDSSPDSSQDKNEAKTKLKSKDKKTSS